MIALDIRLGQSVLNSFVVFAQHSAALPLFRSRVGLELVVAKICVLKRASEAINLSDGSCGLALGTVLDDERVQEVLSWHADFTRAMAEYILFMVTSIDTSLKDLLDSHENTCIDALLTTSDRCRGCLQREEVRRQVDG